MQFGLKKGDFSLIIGGVAEWSKALRLGRNLIEAWVQIPPPSNICDFFFLLADNSLHMLTAGGSILTLFFV